MERDPVQEETRQEDPAADSLESIFKDTIFAQKTAPNVLQSAPLNASIPFNRTDAYVNVYVQDFIHVSAPYRSVFKTAMVPYRFGHLYATHFRTGDTPETRKNLEDAFAACAATYFALKEHDVHSKIQGHVLYLKLLRQLKNDVKNGLANSDPAVFLYTCMMAAHYEVLTLQDGIAALPLGTDYGPQILTSVSASTWLYHLSALGKLIQSLGPYSFTDPLAGAILEVVRPYIIFDGLMECKRTFLEGEDWRNIPINSYPGGSSAWNQLVDLMTPMPRMLESVRLLMTNFTADAAAVHLQLCLTIARNLLVWREEWDRTYGLEPYTYPVPSSQVAYLSAQDEQGPLFETVLFFENISICTTVFYYSQMFLILANHMTRLIPWFELYLGKYDPLTIQLHQSVSTFEVNMLCLEIGRCIDYQRAPEYQHGSTGLFFGAKVAYDIVDKTSRLGRFLERAILDSPIVKRVGVSGANDILKGYYGPEPPTQEDIIRVQQQRMGQLYVSAQPMINIGVDLQNQAL
ncbi:hypothetical protein ABW19_dt0203914 [Dactylella cylindrospora]|nr:hypothetical protein ABW19_dt0203914 [Dactylella cylindrospora]